MADCKNVSQRLSLLNQLL